MKYRCIYFLYIVLGGFYATAQTVSIVASPGASICSGSNVLFTATPTNIPNPVFQWYKNGVAIPGETSSTYLVYNGQSVSNGDQFYVTCKSMSNIVRDSMLLWLDAGITASYNGTGTTWTDLSGNGKNGTLTAAQTYSSGDGGYFQFNGINSPVLINQVSSATTNVTMSCWVHITPGTTQGTFIKNGGTNGYAFGAGGNTGFNTGFCANTFPGMLLSGQSWLGSSAGSQTNFVSGWQLCTMVISGTSYKYYINGVLATSETFSGALPPNALYTALGANYGDGGGCVDFNGKMATAYFYNRALTPAEIQQNYNALAPRFGLIPSSNVITMTVNATPTVNAYLTGSTCLGRGSLSTTSGLSSYIWYKDGQVISGATTNTYTPTTSGNYRVKVSNGTCENMSEDLYMFECGPMSSGVLTPSNALNSDGGRNRGKTVNQFGKLRNSVEVISLNPASVSGTTATLGVTMYGDIVTSMGIEYKLVSDPTFTMNQINTNVSSNTTLSTTVTGLLRNSNYVVRGYATNSFGTFYGTELYFTTLP